MNPDETDQEFIQKLRMISDDIEKKIGWLDSSRVKPVTMVLLPNEYLVTDDVKSKLYNAKRIITDKIKTFKRAIENLSGPNISSRKIKYWKLVKEQSKDDLMSSEDIYERFGRIPFHHHYNALFDGMNKYLYKENVLRLKFPFTKNNYDNKLKKIPERYIISGKGLPFASRYVALRDKFIEHYIENGSFVRPKSEVYKHLMNGPTTPVESWSDLIIDIDPVTAGINQCKKESKRFRPRRYLKINLVDNLVKFEKRNHDLSTNAGLKTFTDLVMAELCVSVEVKKMIGHPEHAFENSSNRVFFNAMENKIMNDPTWNPVEHPETIRSWVERFRDGRL